MNTLFFIILRYALYTLLHFLFLIWIQNSDMNGQVNEIVFAILMIPCGIINFFLSIKSLSMFRAINSDKIIFILFAWSNFIMYVLISLKMPSLSGSVIN